MTPEAPINPNPPEKQTGLFDMKEELTWFEQNIASLKGIFGPPLQAAEARSKALPSHITIENAHLLPLPLQQLNNILHLFPDSIINRRSTLNRIVANPPRYFARTSAPGRPVMTDNVAEALSPTAFNPAETFYHQPSLTAPKSTMTIFRVPEGMTVDGKPISAEALALAYSQKLVHEYTHTFINDLLIRKSAPLRLPGGQVIEGKQMIQEFERLAVQKGPMSTYDGAYRNGNDFQTDPNNPVVRNTAIVEALAEAITARVVGFTYSKEPQRRFAPFSDRPEMQHFVDLFLEAELVEQAA